MSARTASRSSPPVQPPRTRRPRLGFLGVGWIGRQRLAAIAESDSAQVVAIADPSSECVAEALRLAPQALRLSELEALLDLELDGVVIATPNALHASQAVAMLERGLAVFCQKPLARTAAEVRRVVDAARAADRLLAVDLSYRFTAAARALRDSIHARELGRVYAADLMFHNAFGPDKPWFRDGRLSGGGCMIDLGSHLIDLALWLLDWPRITSVSARLFATGQPLPRPTEQVEDYAVAQLEVADGVVVRIACSWNLHAGRDAVIEATFFGTHGGCGLRNVNGSFYDFVADRFDGRTSRRLVDPPDAWGGRGAVDWVRRLAHDAGFDPEVENSIIVAEALDEVYGR